MKKITLLLALSSLLIGCNQNTPSPNLLVDNSSPISSLVKEAKVDREDIEYYYSNYFADYYNSDKCAINFIRETPKKDIYYTVWKENLTFDFTLLVIMQIELKDNKYQYYDLWSVDKALTFDDFSSLEIGKSSFDDVEKMEHCWTYNHSGRYSIHHMIDGSSVTVNYDENNIVTSINHHSEEKFISEKDAKELATLLND